MNITLQIDSVSYDHKPHGAEIAAIKPRMSGSQPVTLALDRFAELVTQGHSFTPAVLRGGAKAENWSSQQLFCLDIDNEDKSVTGKHDKKRAEDPLTVEKVLERCSSWWLKPALIYETFSSSPEWQKFRIVFVSEQVITDRAKAEKLQLALIGIFPECDAACKNADRLFFGGKNVLYEDDTAVITSETAEKLVDIYGFSFTVPSAASGKDKQLDELKRDFDFLGYIRSFGGSEHRMGKCIQFNPCPICGHNDDFCFYPETNTFKCFGASGDCGGSVIDFIMHREQTDRKAAIHKFKYELCGLSEAEDKAKYRHDIMIERYNASASEDEQVDELPRYIYAEPPDLHGNIKYRVSRPLLAEYIRTHCHYFFVNDTTGNKNVHRYWYINGVYKLVNDNEIKGVIKGFVARFDISLVKMPDIDEVFKNITTDLKFLKYSDMDTNENIINFENGLLHLDTMELTPHTHDIISTIQIACKWNPSAAYCPNFSSYMNTFTDGNREVQQLLLQFMGVALSNVHGYRMKKSLFISGEGNSGKSQLRVLCAKLLGEEHTSSAGLDTYEQRFGTNALIGKRLIGSPDMPYARLKGVTMFKMITGGDGLPLEAKCGGFYTITFNGVMWNCGNKLPSFGGDRGPHVYERFVTVRCDNVIPKEKQDKKLLDKMYAEREAIVVLAVKAVKKVIENGYRYDIPEICLKYNKEYQIENSPILTFYKECCCEREQADNCTCARMYDVFKAWCKDNSGYTPKKSEFRQELADFLAGGDISKLTKKINGDRYYTFTVTTEAKRTYERNYGFDNSSIAV